MGDAAQNPFADPETNDNPFHAPAEGENPFGETTEPDMSAIKGHIQKNLAGFAQKIQGDDTPTPVAPELAGNKGRVVNLGDVAAPKGPNPFDDSSSDKLGNPPVGAPAPSLSGPVPVAQPGPDAKKPPSFLDAVEAGYQMSVTGLLLRGKKPDFQLPQDAPAYLRIASQITAMAADGPEFGIGGLMGAVAGGAAGAATGPAAPVLAPAGIVAGGGAGAFALPAAMRSILMQHYEKGDIKDFQDFWERSSAVFIDSLKQGALGAATVGVGAATGGVLAPLTAPAVATAGVMASQVATMVGLGSAMEGKVPSLSDFGDAAAAVLLMHGGLKVTEPIHGPVIAKLRNIYEKTGIPPVQVADQAVNDPLLRQELMGDGKKIPTALEPFIEKPTPQPEVPGFTPPPEPPKDITPKLPAEMTDVNPVLIPDAKPERISIEPMSNERGSVGHVEEPEPVTDLDKALKDILDNMDTRSGPKFKLATPAELYEGVLDGLDPFKRAIKEIVTKGELPAELDPYKSARLSANAVDKTQTFIKHETFDYADTSKKTGMSLSEALESVQRKDIRKFNAFLTARRSIELEADGITPGKWKSESSQIVDESLKEKFGKAAEESTDYENRLLKYLADSGRISQESYGVITGASKNHTPFYRLMEDGTGIGGTGRGGPKRIKGANLGIVYPVESIVRNSHAYMQMAEQNRAVSLLVDLTQNTEAGREIMRRVGPMSNEAPSLSSEQMAKHLEANGIEVSPATVEGAKAFSGVKKSLGENQIVHWVDGKPIVYETTPAIARAFRAMDGNRTEMNFIVKIATAPASLLRGTLASTPDFIMRHWERNGIVAGTFSSAGHLVSAVAQQLSAVSDLFPHNGEYRQVYIDFLKSGGSNGSLITIDQRYVEKNVFELSKKTGLIDSMQNVLRHPLDNLHALATIMDNASRMSEFKRVAGSDPTHADLVRGGYAAREVIPDPLRRGSYPWIRLLDKISPFTNLRFQGLDRIVRAIGADPKGMAVSIASNIVLPSVALWAYRQWQMNDPSETGAGGTYKERWDAIPEIQKDLAWVLMTDKHTFRPPKPFELGILFGSMFERTLDEFAKLKPNMFKELGLNMQVFAPKEPYKGAAGALVDAAMPSAIPTFISPFYDQFANRSSFTGHTIIPSSLEKGLPQDQATNYTTDTAKMLGGILQKVPFVRDFGPEHAKITSPMILENYVRAWSGNFGMYALHAADKALDVAEGRTKILEEPISLGRAGKALADKLYDTSNVVPHPDRAETPWSDEPFIKAFMIREPSAGAQQIQDFYDNYAQHEDMIAHQKKLVEAGDTRNLRLDFGPDQPENRERLVSLQGFKTALSAQSGFIKLVEKNPNMGPKDKRQMIDKLTWGMIREAAAANKLLDQIHEKIGVGH